MELKEMGVKRMNWLLFLLLAAGLTSCAPVFSDLQSARTVGKGKVELTPGATNTYAVDSENSSAIQQHFGAQLAYGLTRRLDVRLRYENISTNFEIPSVDVLGFGLKYAVVPDILAVYVPVGGVINKNFEERQFQTQPTLLFTLPIVANKIELNMAGKSIFYFDYEGVNMAWNMGFGLSTNLKKWVLRPEYGRLYEIDGQGAPLSQLSLGFSWVF